MSSPPRSLAPEAIRHKINRLRGTVDEYYGSEFQVIPIKRFLSRALTYIHTYKHTNIHPKSKQYPRRVHYVLGVDNNNNNNNSATMADCFKFLFFVSFFRAEC